MKIEAPEEKILRYLEKQIIKKDSRNTAPVLQAVLEDSYRRLIGPAIEREIRAGLTEKAEAGAIRVFGKNLKQLLMQPPVADRVVLGWDPAFRTGCKLAVVDGLGKVLDTVVIFPTAPQNKVEESKQILKNLIRKYGISLISLGNGTASRESEQVIVELLKEIPEKVQYVIVNGGRRLCLLCQPSGHRRISQVRRGPEKRCIHCQKASGSPGRAGEN